SDVCSSDLVAARDARHLHRQPRHPAQHEDVEVVEPAGLHLHHRLPRPRRRLRPVVAEPDLLQAAVGVDRDRPHQVFLRSTNRKSQCDAPSITVWVRVSCTSGLKPSTSEKSRLQESSAPTSGMPSARYISAYRHRVTLKENFSSVCSSTSMR